MTSTHRSLLVIAGVVAALLLLALFYSYRKIIPPIIQPAEKSASSPVSQPAYSPNSNPSSSTSSSPRSSSGSPSPSGSGSSDSSNTYNYYNYYPAPSASGSTAGTGAAASGSAGVSGSTSGGSATGSVSGSGSVDSDSSSSPPLVLPPAPVYNSNVFVNRLFPNQYENTKYSLTISDPEGLGTFSVAKANGTSIYAGGGNLCRAAVTSGTLTLYLNDFPLKASVVDCSRPAVRTEFSLNAPALPPPADLVIVSFSSPFVIRESYYIKVVVYNQGSGVAGPFIVAMKKVVNGKTQLVEQSVNGLASQTSKTVEFRLGSLSGFGTIRAFADYQTQVVESNEANNSRQISD